MKRFHKVWGLGAIATLLLLPVLFETPVSAQLRQVGEAIAQSVQREPELKLNLSAEKRQLETDATGKAVESWQGLSGQATVQPGDVLRYRLSGMNQSDRALRNLVVTQPIPASMQYVLGSVVSPSGTATTYSIDGGSTFVANPTIQVTLADGTVQTRPAPAEKYTHIRWNFGEAIAGRTSLEVAYQVQVR